MNQLYANLRYDLIPSLIKSFGTSLDLIAESEGRYIPSAGVVEQIPPVITPAYGIITGYETKDIDGMLIKVGDRRVLIPAVGVPEPTSKYVVSLKSVRWSVVRCDTIAPDGEPILYDVQVRI